MRGGNGDAYQAAYKTYSTLEGAAYHQSPTLPANGILRPNRSFEEVKMRQPMAGVVASYGVYQQDEQDDDHGFRTNSRNVTTANNATAMLEPRHCLANPSAVTTSSTESWMTCCRPIVLLLTLILLIIVFVFVSGVLLYINYITYKPRQSYIEEPCEKTFCAWGAQCVTGTDGAARCQCPTHCRPHVDQPVCGGDGRTYESHCHLRMAACRARLNVRVIHEGKCGHNDFCKNKHCPFGGRCILSADGRNASCQCPTKCPNYGDHGGSRPVCGSNGQDYENQCELRRAACHAGGNITVRFSGKCDPCRGMTCPSPGICQLDERRHPSCRCDEKCPRGFDPVCGTDGKTYANECSLRQESCKINWNIGVVYRGKCSEGHNPCESVKCTLGEFCAIDKFGIARCKCRSSCPQVLKPICGKDGKTYGSVCEIQREGCLARVKLEVDYVGICGTGNACHGGGGGCRHGAVCVVRGDENYCECPECSEVFEPVCGNDGVTYINECHLIREGCLSKNDISVNYIGICDACLQKQCDYFSLCQTSSNKESQVEDAYCVCPTSCNAFRDLKLQVNETVCGSNGVTFANECALRIAACKAEQNIMVAYKGDCDLCARVECKHGGRCETGECVCPTRCEAAGDEPVCASNLTTFRNECELQKAACEQRTTGLTLGSSFGPGQKLTVLFYGDCKERYAVPGSFTTENPTMVLTVSQTSNTRQTFEISIGTDTSILPENSSSPANGCKDIQCDFEATCELGPDNFPLCVCQFNCTLSPEIDSKPVCASNMKIYPSTCEMKMESCQSQSELRLRPLDLCQGMEIKPCNGDKPLVDSLTNNELDCGNGPKRQDCPSGSYCHQTTRFAKCCIKDQSFLQTSCDTSWFGCCLDGKTPAQGPEQLGCPIMCGCNKLGSYSEACDPLTNACKCRPGVGGEKCDRCEPGYWGLPKISSGHHGCIPCGCSTYGSVRDDCEQMTGRCVCKPGVQGQKCTECASISKTLTSSGCITFEAARQPVTSCKDLICHYGATCIERNYLVYCECPEDTPCPEDQSDSASMLQTVCGTDGQSYPSVCTLRKVACKLQKDIVVQSFGQCKNSESFGSGTDWPTKHYTPLQFTQSDDSNSPLSKSTRHLLHIQKYSLPKFDSGSHSHTKQAFQPTPGTVRVFTAFLGDLCLETQDCPILYSQCIHGTCSCLPEYFETNRQECIHSNEISEITEILPEIPNKLHKTYEVPAFKGQSYIKLKPLKAYYKLSLELEFKTFDSDGILFYNQQSSDNQDNDFLSLSVRNSFVEFRYNLGDGPVIITSLEKVIHGKFHRIIAKRYHRDGMLQLDNGENIAGQSRGKLRALDLHEDGYLGGVPDLNQRVHHNMGITSGLQGCIRRFKIGRKTIDLNEGYDDIVIHSKNIQKCSIDFKAPIKTPINLKKFKTAEISEFGVPEFDGTSFLMFPTLQSFKYGLEKKFKIDIIFLSKVNNGLLLYNGQLENGRGDFVAVSLIRGHLQFRFNLGSGIANLTTKEVISLGKWHHVKVTRRARSGTLQLDNGTLVYGLSGLPLTELNLKLPLYIGALKKWSSLHRLSGVGPGNGFKGAIQRLSINDIPFNLTNLIECKTIESNAGSPARCGYKTGLYNGPPCPLKGNPCQNGGRCASHLDDYVCHCLDSYEGQNCDILKNDASSSYPSIKLSGDMFLTYNHPSYQSHDYNLSSKLLSVFGLGVASQKVVFNDSSTSFERQRRKVNQAGDNNDDAANENKAKFYDTSGKSERGSRYEFRLRAATSDGLLLWQAADEEYFSIGIVAGYPELSFNLNNGKTSYTITAVTRIDDGSWHTLYVRWNNEAISIQVDEEPQKEVFVKDKRWKFENNSVFYLGSGSSLPQHLQTQFHKNFQGCLHSIHIDSKPINLLNPLNSNSIKLQHCDEQ